MLTIKRKNTVTTWIAAFLLGVFPLTVSGSHYELTPLISDKPDVAEFIDSQLANPQGLFFLTNGDFWVTNKDSHLSTLYSQKGNRLNSSIIHFSRPVGAVRNEHLNAFFIGNELSEYPASYIFSTEEGKILGFNAYLDAKKSVIAADRSSFATVYKGLDIIESCCGQVFVYSNDFRNAKTDIFDSCFNFQYFTKDYTIPKGYAPFNIRNLNGLVYVTYAKQLAPDNSEDEAGPGHGYINVFSSSGAFIKRLISKGNLNSPWGLAIAPSTFGDFGDALLVGNLGDGLIHAYDVSTGAFLGQLKDKQGNPLQIDGLKTLEFDTQGTLYFSAGRSQEGNGLIGKISSIP